MARTHRTPAQIVDAQMAQLRHAITRLLLDNKNFESGHYSREFPGSGGFIHGPLKDMAEHILHRLDETRQVAMDMAADREVNGLNKCYGGEFHGHSVMASHDEAGLWTVTIEVIGAFHNGDDRKGEYKTEAEALEAIDRFVTTGMIPDSMGPMEDAGPSPSGPR